MLFYFLLINAINIINAINNDLTLANYLFTVKFENNKILLNDYDNNNISITYKNIAFNNINNDIFDIYDTIICNNSFVEIKHKIYHSITNYNKNTLQIVYNINTNYINSNNFISQLIFNKPFYYDYNNHVLEINNFIIVFPKSSLIQINNNDVYIKNPSYYYIYYKN